MNKRALYLLAAGLGIFAVLAAVLVVTFAGTDEEGGLVDQRAPARTEQPPDPSDKQVLSDPKPYNPKGDPKASARQQVAPMQLRRCRLGRLGPLDSVRGFEDRGRREARATGTITVNGGARAINYYVMPSREAAAKFYNGADTANRFAAGDGAELAAIEIRKNVVLVMAAPTTPAQNSTLDRCLGPIG